MQGGGDEDGGESVGWRYVGPVRRRVYRRNPKHGPAAHGNVSREPADGQEALDYSVPVKPTSPVRVGIDYVENEIVVLRFEGVFHDLPPTEIFHGYVVRWEDLAQEFRNPLLRAGMVNLRGKIL